jgi:hypothetical protein
MAVINWNTDIYGILETLAYEIGSHEPQCVVSCDFMSVHQIFTLQIIIVNSNSLFQINITENLHFRISTATIRWQELRESKHKLLRTIMSIAAWYWSWWYGSHCPVCLDFRSVSVDNKIRCVVRNVLLQNFFTILCFACLSSHRIVMMWYVNWLRIV